MFVILDIQAQLVSMTSMSVIPAPVYKVRLVVIVVVCSVVVMRQLPSMHRGLAVTLLKFHLIVAKDDQFLLYS